MQSGRVQRLRLTGSTCDCRIENSPDHSAGVGLVGAVRSGVQTAHIDACLQVLATAGRRIRTGRSETSTGAHTRGPIQCTSRAPLAVNPVLAFQQPTAGTA